MTPAQMHPHRSIVGGHYPAGEYLTRSARDSGDLRPVVVVSSDPTHWTPRESRAGRAA